MISLMNLFSPEYKMDMFLNFKVVQGVKLGVSEVTVSQWAQEKSFPTKKHLEKICAVLNVSIKDLNR